MSHAYSLDHQQEEQLFKDIHEVRTCLFLPAISCHVLAINLWHGIVSADAVQIFVPEHVDLMDVKCPDLCLADCSSSSEFSQQAFQHALLVSQVLSVLVLALLTAALHHNSANKLFSMYFWSHRS